MIRLLLISPLVVHLFLAVGIADESDGDSNGVSQPTLDELLLFFPSKFPVGDWEPADLTYKDVYFSTDDGTRLHGWFCPTEKRRAVVLISHGNAGNVASRASWLRYLQSKMNLTVFMYDYRGYGRSDGTPSVAGAIQDGIAARKQLCELARCDDDEIILMGESLGGAIAIQLAALSQPRALILQSTFSSMREVADVLYPKLAWLVPRDKLDSVSVIGNYRGPLLQSHGTSDRVIPFALGQRLYRAASEPKTFIKIDRAGHNNWSTREYLFSLDRFIRTLDKPPQK